jgi:translation initiation factor 1
MPRGPQSPKPRASQGQARVPDDGVVRLHRAKAGKGGKAATRVTGLPGDDGVLDALLKQLKQSLGTGGSREGRDLVLQGDQREKLRERLETMGHRVRIAGG